GVALARTGGAVPGRLLHLPADHEPRPFVPGLQPDEGHLAVDRSPQLSRPVHEQRVLDGCQEHADPDDGRSLDPGRRGYGPRALLQPEPAWLRDRARHLDPAHAADPDRGRSDVAGAPQPSVGTPQLAGGEDGPRLRRLAVRCTCRPLDPRPRRLLAMDALR